MNLQQPLPSYNGKPEIDDGHTKIANELLDAILCHDFSKRQLKIIFYIIRKTYGWNKSEDDISRSQIVDATGLKNPHVTTTIQELLEMNVIIVGTGNHAKRYKINKYYDTWRVTKTVIVTKTVNVTETVIVTETVTDCYQNGNFSLPKQYPQKTTPKDNTKDNNSSAKKYIPPIEPDLLKEWLLHRKKKPVTERVIKKIENEASKLGWSLKQAIEYCCENSWQGFEAAWVNKKSSNNKFIQQDNELAEYNKHTSKLAKERLFGNQQEKDITNETERL